MKQLTQLQMLLEALAPTNKICDKCGSVLEGEGPPLITPEQGRELFKLLVPNEIVPFGEQK